MKPTTRGDWIRSLQLWGSCLIEYVFFLPIFLVAHVYLVPDWISFTGLMIIPALSLAGVLLRYYLPVVWKRFGFSLLLGTVYAAVASAGSKLGILLCLTAGAVAAFQGTSSDGRKNRQKLYWCGIGSYLLAWILFPRFSQLSALIPLITWLGVLCFAWTLLAANRKYLHYSTFSGEAAANSLPHGMRRHNTVWIGSIVAVAVLLALGAGNRLGLLLLGLIRTIVRWLTGHQKEIVPEQEEQAPEAPPMEMPFLEEPHEPGWLSQFLDVAFYVLGTTAILAFLAFGLYWLYKHGGGIWRRWFDRLSGILRRKGQYEQETAFVDEETKLMAWETAAQKWKRWRAPFLSRFGKRERWEDLSDNRERIRYLYRSILRADQAEGYIVKPYLTPQETETELRNSAAAPKAREAKSAWEKRRFAAQALLGMYYRARYGNQELPDEEIARMKRDIQS